MNTASISRFIMSIGISGRHFVSPVPATHHLSRDKGLPTKVSGYRFFCSHREWDQLLTSVSPYIADASTDTKLLPKEYIVLRFPLRTLFFAFIILPYSSYGFLAPATWSLLLVWVFGSLIEIVWHKIIQQLSVWIIVYNAMNFSGDKDTPTPTICNILLRACSDNRRDFGENS